MATPKPGEIRCPTCHRSTPPAAFCTQCGSPIPSDARARPRGMDRDELQERIRARRSGGEPYRRGGPADEGAFERFEPEPEDSQARRTEQAPDRRADYFDDAAARRTDSPSAGPERPDLTRDRDDWTAPVTPAVPPATTAHAGATAPEVAPPRETEPAYAEPATVGDDEPYSDGRDYGREEYDYDEAGGYPYEYDSWEDRRPRRSGTGAFAIIGFLALGVIALLGGAFLAGVFSGDDDGVGQVSPSPSITASQAPIESEAPSVAPSVAPTEDASAAPLPTGEPVVFPDGARFEVQMCASPEMDFQGCAQRAEFISGGSFVAWIGFSGASGSDTLLLVLRENGASVADSEFQLGGPPFNCDADCTGYARQGFSGLPPGEYTLEVLRNGEPAHAITIGVD